MVHEQTASPGKLELSIMDSRGDLAAEYAKLDVTILKSAGPLVCSCVTNPFQIYRRVNIQGCAGRIA